MRGRGEPVGDGRAVLLGDLDVAWPLRRAGIPVTVVARREDPIRFSRLRLECIDDPRPDEQALVERLVRFATRAAEPPVLFFENDQDLGFVLRHRDVLAEHLRYVLADPELVRQLLDKAAFQQLAARVGLPVPPAAVVATNDPEQPSPIPLPAVLKPLGQGRGWGETTPFGGGKATLVRSPAELAATLARLEAIYDHVLLQQLVPGPETRIESYHVYVDADGGIAGEFTGRKLRTHPEAYGFSTALTSTAAVDVVELGREVIRAIGLRGVAKLDFKRDDDGRLWLLEINPRVNLWHHLGAAGGCNLPALVFADLTGRPRPPVRPVPAGVTWCWLPRDLLVARHAGVGVARYLRWLASCDAVAGAIPTDPWPFLRGRMWPLVRDRRRAPVAVG